MIYLIEDIAQEIITDLNLDIAAATVAFWIRNNIGTLNNLIFTSYSINDGDGQISPDINIEAISILKKIYERYNLERVIRENLTASAFTAPIEISENGNRIRLTNRVELGKVYSELRGQCARELDSLVNSYLLKQSGASPVSVDGLDGSWPQEGFTVNENYSRT